MENTELGSGVDKYFTVVISVVKYSSIFEPIMMVDTNKLMTFRNYAKKKGVSRVRLYQMAREIGNKLDVVVIDGVKFIRIK